MGARAKHIYDREPPRRTRLPETLGILAPPAMSPTRFQEHFDFSDISTRFRSPSQSFVSRSHSFETPARTPFSFSLFRSVRHHPARLSTLAERAVIPLPPPPFSPKRSRMQYTESPVTFRHSLEDRSEEDVTLVRRPHQSR